MLGARASYTKFGLDVQEDALRHGARPGDRGWGEERPDQWGTLSDGEMARRVPTERGAYEMFYARVAAAVRGEGPLPVEPEDAVVTATVIEAALQSARERSAVPIGAV